MSRVRNEVSQSIFIKKKGLRSGSFCIKSWCKRLVNTKNLKIRKKCHMSKSLCKTSAVHDVTAPSFHPLLFHKNTNNQPSTCHSSDSNELSCGAADEPGVSCLLGIFCSTNYQGGYIFTSVCLFARFHEKCMLEHRESWWEDVKWVNEQPFMLWQEWIKELHSFSLCSNIGTIDIFSHKIMVLRNVGVLKTVSTPAVLH